MTVNDLITRLLSFSDEFARVYDYTLIGNADCVYECTTKVKLNN